LNRIGNQANWQSNKSWGCVLISRNVYLGFTGSSNNNLSCSQNLHQCLGLRVFLVSSWHVKECSFSSNSGHISAYYCCRYLDV
jgi:hypothetical protein